MTTILHMEAPRPVESGVEAAAVLRVGEVRHRLWWRIPAEWASACTTWADPFVVGMLFLMMEGRREVRVEGVVSPSLLENLERYMAAWRAWDPGRYAVVPIKAEREAELPLQESQEVVTSFSGGVDSCFTLARHLDGAAGRANRRIGAAVVMNGFDIWPDQKNASAIFAGVLRGVRAQLAQTPVSAIVVSTNFHELPVLWADAFGTQLISGLMLFAGRFHGTLVPNSQGYLEAAKRWGSTPLTDHLLGSRQFPVLDDGAAESRGEKIEYLMRWPGLLEHLRVCFPLDGRFENCCRCEKCLRTIMAFRVAKLEVPRGAFSHEVSNRQIAGMKFHSQLPWEFWRELLRLARERGLAKERWAVALATAVRRGARRHRLQQLKRPLIPLRNRLRTMLRGSAESRSQRKRRGG